jgi:hypothetical protein
VRLFHECFGFRATPGLISPTYPAFIDFLLDSADKLGCNPADANAWFVRFNTEKRESSQKPFLAFHPDGERCGLSGCAGLLGLHPSGGLFFCFLSRDGARDYGSVGPAILLLGGVGVRGRSRYAAAVVLAMYVADALASRPGVVTVFICALLLSNLRATWIAANWKADSEESILPPRLAETWGDRFADRLPLWLWPKVRVAYYVFSGCLLLMVGAGLILKVLHRTG